MAVGIVLFATTGAGLRIEPQETRPTSRMIYRDFTLLLRIVL